MKSNESKKEKLIKKCIGILILIVIIHGFFLHFKFNSELKNHKITSGLIIGSEQDYRGSLKLKYIYYVNDKMYSQLDYHSELYTTSAKEFEHRLFPVVYAVNDPKLSEILVSTHMFKKYNMHVPDSLNWIREFEK